LPFGVLLESVRRARPHSARIARPRPRSEAAGLLDKQDRSSSVYAIVRAGGRQEKVTVGDVLEVDRLQGAPGSTIEWPALLLVDGESVTSDAEALAAITVTAEIVENTKGPKIIILKYKNKTGYRKRQGHRQKLTQVKVTGISGPEAK
jgi:large subunit ribosomal protein L21